MKLLVIADDLHGVEISDVLQENKDIDLILTLGDLSHGELIDLEDTNIPIYGVYGNHCNGEYFDKLNIKNLHMKTTEFKNFSFGGFEGCIKYKDHGPFMYKHSESSRIMADLPYVDILVLHSPPYGINNNDDVAHQGLEGSRTYIDKYSPKHVFHGHTYKKPFFVDKYKDSKIHYVTGAKIIEIEENNLKDKFISFIKKLTRAIKERFLAIG